MQSSFSALLLDSEKEKWEEYEPWLNRHNEPHHRGWLWWKTTRRPALKTTLRPTMTIKRPGPKICRNMKIVSRIQDATGPVVCLRRNITELMAQLKSVGGLIKRYAAVQVIDACGFEDLTPIESPNATRPPAPSVQSDSREPSVQSSPSRDGKRQAEQLHSDSELQRRKRTLPTSPGTVFRGCQGRGTIIDGTSEHRLCTECAATTRLPNSRFPTYINEVVCRDNDMQCAAKMGMCHQRYLNFPFLQSTGMFQFDALQSAIIGKLFTKKSGRSTLKKSDRVVNVECIRLFITGLLSVMMIKRFIQNND